MNNICIFFGGGSSDCIRLLFEINYNLGEMEGAREVLYCDLFEYYPQPLSDPSPLSPSLELNKYI